MTETSECAPLISVDKFEVNDGDDEQGASADIEIVIDETSDNQNTTPPATIQQAAAPTSNVNVNSQGLLSAGANIQHASAGPLQCNNCHQHTMVMTESTTSTARQMQVTNRTPSDDLSINLCILLVFSSLSCLVCWPLAITALPLTGYLQGWSSRSTSISSSIWIQMGKYEVSCFLILMMKTVLLYNELN
ncbi:uncharacterized protein [Dysidea avara]|uniref:uncharacterized protein n=1 Tax=Dysidea avara TaxID=196820 RepID=UPI00332E69B6